MMTETGWTWPETTLTATAPARKLRKHPFACCFLGLFWVYLTGCLCFQTSRTRPSPPGSCSSRPRRPKPSSAARTPRRRCPPRARTASPAQRPVRTQVISSTCSIVSDRLPLALSLSLSLSLALSLSLSLSLSLFLSLLCLQSLS